jgi:hypothetical protein
MSPRRYLVWFLSVVGAAFAAMVAFNIAADAYILNHRAGASVQTVSGFERVLKPAWLDSVKPELVFVGSSRMREGFDPALIDPALHVKSFNYGVSSITPYEARRYFEDALAQPSVKTVVMSLDAFSGGDDAAKTGTGFDELRLAVTADGRPTPRRDLWLFTTRYLSGGALGMHALGLYLLAQLAPNQTAADRPDLFTAYGHMDANGMRRDLANRSARLMRMGARPQHELTAALAALCHRQARAYLFFPPDNDAVIARYLANDAAGLAVFKQAVRAEAIRHNRTCTGKVVLFDFMDRNALTAEAMPGGVSPDYVDLVHFRPPTGLRLLRRMMAPQSVPKDAHLGTDMIAPGPPCRTLTRKVSGDDPCFGLERPGGPR